MAWQELPWIPEKMEKNNPNSILHVSEKQESFKDLKAMKSSFLTLASSFDFSVLDFVLGGLVKMVKEILTYLKETISLAYNLG